MMTKKKIVILVIFLCVIIAAVSCFAYRQLFAGRYTELGCPAETYYQYNNTARCVWDIEVFNGRIYVGTGDYDKNTGPVPLLCSSVNDLGNWNVACTLPDEEIHRFVFIDGLLTIPGIDPRGSPESGTYYQCVEDAWVIKSGILDGFHNFDLIEYDGMLFAGIGALRGKTPVICSDDESIFRRVPMFKNGDEISTSDGECIRTHDFFILNDTLYATFWFENQKESELVYDIYRYNNNGHVFEFDNSWVEKCDDGYIKKINTIDLSSFPIGGKAVFNNHLFLATGYLYVTPDMNDLTRVEFPHSAIVYDVITDDDVLYVLTAYAKSKEYEITVYSNNTGNPSDFRKHLSFSYEIPPTCFACDSENFYIGMGDFHKYSEKNGMVLLLEKK